jgi:hypothetical protein
MADAVEEFFARYAPDIQAVSQTLRTMVMSAMPEAIERLFASQDHVSYLSTQSARDELVYICPMKHYVRLGFYYGANLPDPQGLLVGEGKRLRHAKVRTREEAQNRALERLVESAWIEATERKNRPTPNLQPLNPLIP